jgi:hypothetical protein
MHRCKGPVAGDGRFVLGRGAQEGGGQRPDLKVLPWGKKFGFDSDNMENPSVQRGLMASFPCFLCEEWTLGTGIEGGFCKSHSWTQLGPEPGKKALDRSQESLTGAWKVRTEAGEGPRELEGHRGQFRHGGTNRWGHGRLGATMKTVLGRTGTMDL